MNQKVKLTASDGRDMNGRSGAGILVVAVSTCRMLFGKRGPRGSSPLTWAPFGGTVEDGESHRAAAIREVGEEAGFDLSRQITLVNNEMFIDRPEGIDFSFHTFLGIVDDECSECITINDESLGFQWMSLDEVLNTLNSGCPFFHPGVVKMFSDEKVVRTLRSILSIRP